MNLTIRVLGIELLSLSLSTDDEQQQNGPGDCTTQPVGFMPSYGDQRWEKGIDL